MHTYMGAKEDFAKLINYMQEHISDFAYALDESSKRWVPINFLKFLNGEEPKFVKRLARLCAELGDEGFRDVDIDVLLGQGVIGNTRTNFLS